MTAAAPHLGGLIRILRLTRVLDHFCVVSHVQGATKEKALQLGKAL
jgi:hypothetical protein